MKEIRRSSKSNRFSSLFSLALAATIVGAPLGAAAQDFNDLQTPKSPLVLKARGSFYVGGDKVQQTSIEVSFSPDFLFRDDQVTVNQMYVEFMIPQGRTKVPVVLTHGATLSGKTYDTTPDGRMGWYEYMVRQSHPVYVVDQVGRARSGFNQAIFNDVAAGLVSPTQQPRFFRLGDNWGSWTNFRFGALPGVAYPDQKFPVGAAAELSKQDIPDINTGLPNPNPSWKALSDLAIKLDGAVLLGHSQSGVFPIEAALIDPAAVKGMVLIEPGSCQGGVGIPVWTDQEIAKLAKIPLLVIFGDHLDTDTKTPFPFLWQESFNQCQALIARINAANGNAQMFWPPDYGIFGNSHMIMQDTNNLQIADFILKWIGDNVRSK